ncbi:MAG: EGF-like domain-containing protein [Sandaracinaceae bacterium]|nr:EGF-like domain-containing protein [Sandaracinaceae bacterium]
MITAASSPGTPITCGTSHVRVTASHSGSPVNNYSFGFSCAAGTSPSPALTDTNWGDRCLDINECAFGPCGAGYACTQRPLPYSAPGYDCTLVDACAANVDNCVAIATCVDTPGSSAVYSCLCPHAGYQGDGRSPGTGVHEHRRVRVEPLRPERHGRR